MKVVYWQVDELMTLIDWQIDEVLKDVEKCEAFTGHVDQLLITCTVQLRAVYSKHMSNDGMYKDVVRLYKCLLATLLSVSSIYFLKIVALSV